MYSDLLARDLEERDSQESVSALERLQAIVSESQRLSRLITNVLEFARQQRGKTVIRPKPARVDDVISACLERFEPILNETDIDVHFDKGAENLVNVDVDALEQILVNLLSNVEKYAAKGKSLVLTSRYQDGTTRIIVEDDGPGVPPGEHDDIFQPFHRVADSLVDAPGTGIGLAIARQLARLHGGDLVLEPSKTGARFCVELDTPLAEIGDGT